jgi:hypothetical protein
MSLLPAFVPSAALDVVGIYQANFRQVLAQARPYKAVIKPDSKVMEHPLETGASTIDHRIILPIEIELALIMQANVYRDVYAQIKQLFLNAELLTIATKASTYPNMLISSMPHEEQVEVYDAIIIELKFRETQFANSRAQRGMIQPKKPIDSPKMDRGAQQPQPVPERKRSNLDHTLGRFVPLSSGR